jgi:predicted PurR-regulated permease PerM
LGRRTGPELPPEVAEIPIGVRRAAAWSWRLLLIGAMLAGAIWLFLQVTTIAVPVLVAILLAAVLTPVVKLLDNHTFLGRGAASAITLVGLVVVVVGMFTLAGRQLVAQFSDISEQAVSGFQTLLDWVKDTFRIEGDFLTDATNEVLSQIQENADSLVSGAVTTASIVGNVVTGILIALFTLFFLLASGPTVWRWCVRLLPPDARVPAHEGFRRGWRALSAYMRTQILVAAVDATGIAIGMVCLGLGKYAVPIWLLVFLFSFIPMIGAIVSGAIAILITLVLQGWLFALIMLAVVLGVQQLEGNILQPVLMGKAVELHPLAVFLGVASGTVVAGIGGALFAIPLLAFVNATMLYLTGRDPAPELGKDDISAKVFMKRPAPAEH